MQTFPDYKIIQTLHRGIRSVVYRAVRKSDKLPVVLKTHTENYPNALLLNRFLREQDIGKRLTGDHLIHYITAHNHGHGVVLVVEDPGSSVLSQLIPKGGMELEQFLIIAVQLARGLASIHDQGFMHKDLKPANIVVNEETLHSKIIDFGLASELPEENLSPIDTNRIEGSLAYMSPEQTGRMNISLDYHTDFYSLGVTFYEMLCGKLPYEEDDKMALVHCHIAVPPPSLKERRKELPDQLCILVERLMAKNPTDRYHSAHGLELDLVACRDQYLEKGKISRFALGKNDFSDRFRISPRLYGRKKELEILLKAFKRASEGQGELVLVAGYSGIGKSSLVREIHKPIVESRGLFTSGKFEQFHDNRPYEALIVAFEELLNNLMSESEDVLAGWRMRLEDALQPNARLLTELFPTLHQLMGPQPEIAQLDPSLAETRFHETFCNLVQVFAHPHHPLVLFLDDLQWADPASMNLLRSLAEESRCCLIIGAYRDNEVDAGHPLTLMLRRLEDQHLPVNSLKLGPLQRRDVARMIADTLNFKPGHVSDLANLVHQRTDGNPFFVNSFLTMLYENDLIGFDRGKREWTWDIDQIQARNITDNVVTMVLERLRGLPPEAHDLLASAGCIGNRFDLDLLAQATEVDPLTIARALLPAIHHGMIAPTRDLFYWVKLIEHADKSKPDPDVLRTSFRFLHDRVQQAACALWTDKVRSERQLAMGRRLFRAYEENPSDSLLFTTINQLNESRHLINRREERIQLAALNQNMAMRARKTLAFKPALDHFAIALELLPEDAWSSCYEMTCSLYQNCAECQATLDNWEEAEPLFETLLQHVREEDRPNICHLLQSCYGEHYYWDKAQDWGRRALALLGQDLPDQNEDLTEATEAARQTFTCLLESWTLEEADFPTAADADTILSIKVWSMLVTHAYLTANMDLHALALFRTVNLMNEKGYLPESALVYSWLTMLYMGQDRYSDAYRLTQMTMRLSEIHPSPEVMVTVSCNLNPALSFGKSRDQILQFLDDNYQKGIQIGQFKDGIHNMGNILNWSWMGGLPLEKLRKKAEEMILVSRRKNYQYSIGYAQIYLWIAQALSSPGRKQTMEQSDFDAQTWAVMQAGHTVSIMHVYQFLHAFWSGWEDKALEYAGPALQALPQFAGYLFWIDVRLCYILLLAQNHTRRSEEEKAADLAEMRTLLDHFQRMARLSPLNYEHKAVLVEAELARLEGSPAIEVSSLYQESATSAAGAGYLHYAALANELHGKFWQGYGRAEYAALHLSEARYLYQRWGAVVVVQRLETQYATLNLATLPGTPNETAGTVDFKSTDSDGLDLYALLKTTRAISEEIELKNLMKVVLQAIVESAGAERGELILSKKGELFIEATATAKWVKVYEDHPATGSGQVPEKMVRFVVRTRETLILDDVSGQARFSNDPYLADNKPKSLLCTPVLHGDVVRGALYLENSLVRRAFTRNRVDVLEILLAQASVSLENARLYAEVQEGKEILEERVKERTRQLKETQRKLVEQARRAGMADIATSVLHNLGNTLNSLVVASQSLQRDLKNSRLKGLNKANALLTKIIEKEDVKDPRMSQLLSYYQQLAGVREEEHHSNLAGLLKIIEQVQMIQRVVADQECYVGRERQDEVLALDMVANEAVGIVEGVLMRHRISLDIQVKDELSVPVQRIKLVHIFVSLFENAVHAMNETPEEKRKLIIKIEKENTHAVVRVSDTGQGIPADLLDKIFAHGFSTRPEAKGFGLHTCANSMAEMGGHMRAESAGTGKGATFVIIFPLDGKKTEAN
ncbi:MAG: AAA family ATPase [Acidobacteriota bacterium]|nr:AAA family ATPase [Acidobacteriota bacterium]